jgi:hypothetical protein
VDISTRVEIVVYFGIVVFVSEDLLSAMVQTGEERAVVRDLNSRYGQTGARGEGREFFWGNDGIFSDSCQSL